MNNADITKTGLTIEQLNGSTAYVTACDTWAEFLEMLGTPEAQKYTPTLSPNTGDTRGAKESKGELQRALTALGYRWF